MRRLIIGTVVLTLLGAAGVWVYTEFFRSDPPPPDLVFDPPPSEKKLSSQEEFDKYAKEDPVKMLAACLTRYQKEVPGGTHFTFEKQERVQGKPKHPEMPPAEVIDVSVRGDLPDPESKKTAIEVVMKWKSGAKKVLGSEIRATLFSENDAEHPGKVRTWRPDATFLSLSPPMPANGKEAQGQSRYCIHDAGLYRTLLRTHTAWKARQDAGEFKFEYLGKKSVEKAGGRECHVIKRTCVRTEIDAFEIGGKPSTDPAVIAVEGFTEVTLYIDAERWLQVGSELYRTEPDGTRVLVGSYFFRDIDLKPTFPPDTFTVAGLKK